MSSTREYRVGSDRGLDSVPPRPPTRDGSTRGRRVVLQRVEAGHGPDSLGGTGDLLRSEDHRNDSPADGGQSLKTSPYTVLHDKRV